METFAAALLERRGWLAEQAHLYVINRGYESHFAALPDCWNSIVRLITRDLTETLPSQSHDNNRELPDLVPEAAAWYASTANGLHRDLGLPLELFLGVLKDLRRSYRQIAREIGLPPSAVHQIMNQVLSFFDGMELALCSSWTAADEMLRESEERYRNLVELSSNAIYIAIEGRFAFANRAGVRLLGGSALEEIVGREVLTFIHPDYRNAEMERILLLAEGVTPLAREEKYLTLEGNIVDVDVASIPFTFQDRPAILIQARDITERKKLEQELEKNERFESLALLAGGIAHDFNNLLVGILGNLSLSKLLTPEEAESFHLLLEAETAALRARDLTRQLLTFARGGAPVKKSATIGELIRETCTFALRGSNVSCIFDIPNDLSSVEVDVGQISQVVQNLVMNADQAMPEGGTVVVVCENVSAADGLPAQLDDERYVRVSIRDSGHGIQPEHLKRIFDPYFTTKQKGSGLGLTTAFSIIKKHDGCILASSELGVGSVFQIYLPASSECDLPSPRPEPACFQGKGKVLFMDDEEAVRFIAGRTLNRMGFEVCFAKDGLQAISLYSEALASDKPFHAVVMDLTIPGGMGGKETVRHLRELDPNCKAFASSGYSDDPVMADPESYGFCGVIPKPFLYEEMAAALRQVFGNL